MLSYERDKSILSLQKDIMAKQPATVIERKEMYKFLYFENKCRYSCTPNMHT